LLGDATISPAPTSLMVGNDELRTIALTICRWRNRRANRRVPISKILILYYVAMSTIQCFKTRFFDLLKQKYCVRAATRKYTMVGQKSFRGAKTRLEGEKYT